MQHKLYIIELIRNTALSKIIMLSSKCCEGAAERSVYSANGIIVMVHNLWRK